MQPLQKRLIFHFVQSLTVFLKKQQSRYNICLVSVNLLQPHLNIFYPTILFCQYLHLSHDLVFFHLKKNITKSILDHINYKLQRYMLMKSQNVVLSSFLIWTPLNSLFCFQYVYANNSEIEILYYSINDTVIYIYIYIYISISLSACLQSSRSSV